MKKFIVIVTSVLMLVFISGCGEVETYKYLSYQQSLVVDGRGDDSTPFSVYIFKNTEGKDVQLYDSEDSSYKELLETNQLYDVTVLVGGKFEMSNYIKGIKRSAK